MYVCKGTKEVRVSGQGSDEYGTVATAMTMVGATIMVMLMLMAAVMVVMVTITAMMRTAVHWR